MRPALVVLSPPAFVDAAALYASARASGNALLCLAHLPNEPDQAGDFEKGDANDATAALAVIRTLAAAWFDGRSADV
ncbi:hypothetical protein [Methylobacterium sp. NEAU K]|uniref:hypothetical protein n=1 Tax=Methylobacterium sp. NEAU K TaxID=3064946 RepID=UPI0027344BC5|nr:hypothetical protein [Methylobacterium sp. NEAU K]MDP4006577.1 hypothetical protein [Methylobacterium sp. NEAU K]